MQELYNFSKIIKELRKQSGMTQKEVAEKLAIKTQSYQSYETGITVPSLQKFIKLADLFDVSLDFLVGRKEI